MSGDRCWAEELAAAKSDTETHVARQMGEEGLGWGEEGDGTKPQVDNGRNQEGRGFLVTERRWNYPLEMLN
jgi:hypothetical protein